QKYIELRIAVGREVQSRFAAAQSHVLELGTYVGVLLESIDRVRMAKNEHDARFQLYYINSRAEHFLQHRDALHEAHMALNGLFAEYGAILGSTWTIYAKLQATVRLVREAWEACSFLPPAADTERADFLAHFLSQCDETVLRKAHAACDRVVEEASALAGYIMGVLQHPVVPPTLPMLVFLVRHGRE